MVRRIIQVAYYISVLSLALILTGCTGKKDASTLHNKEFQKNFNNGNYYFHNMCESDTGYYALLNGFLFYIEKDSLENTVVCGKIECNHSDTNCNGYIGSECNILNYDDKIYYSTTPSNSVNVYQMDLDGTNRKKYYTIPNSDDLTTVCYILHRDHFFYVGEGVFVDIKTTPSFATAGEYSIDDNPMGVYSLWADDNYVYMESYNSDYQQVFYRYDFESKQFELIWKVPDPSIVGEWATAGIGINGWYITNNVLYYYLSGNGVWKTDLISGTTKCLFEISDKSLSGYASFDEARIYIDTGNRVLGDSSKENHAIYVFDYTANQLGVYPYGHLYEADGVSGIMISGTNNAKVFLSALFTDTILQNMQNIEISSNEEGVFCIDMDSQSLKKVIQYSESR